MFWFDLEKEMFKCWQCISDLYFVCVESRLQRELVNLSVSAVASPGAEHIENIASNKTSNMSTAKQDITQVLDVELSTAAGS